MIVRIKFEGLVRDGKKKSVLPDHVDIHVPPGSKELAKEIFIGWIEKGVGIRGDSGVFHPITGCGEIKLKKVTEVSGGEEDGG